MRLDYKNRNIRQNISVRNIRLFFRWSKFCPLSPCLETISYYTAIGYGSVWNKLPFLSMPFSWFQEHMLLMLPWPENLHLVKYFVSVFVFGWLGVLFVWCLFCFVWDSLILVTIVLLWRDTWPMQLLKESTSWELDYSFKELAHDHHDGEHGGRRAGRHGATAVAKHSHIIWKFQSDRVWLGMTWAFETSSKKVTPLNPSQTVPLTGNQPFEYINLWWPFSFKPQAYVA